MNGDKIRKEYFDWLCRICCGNKARRYLKLLKQLYGTSFYYLIENDSNREQDGVDLRYRFGYLYDYDDREIASVLDCKECSVLEMMAALAIRCEEMTEDGSGEYVSDYWFGHMLRSLGLYNQTNGNYDSKTVDNYISDLLDRRYRDDGKGGLFMIPNYPENLRHAEIWNQACWYIDYVLYGGIRGGK